MSSPTQGELDDTETILENVTNFTTESSDEAEKLTELSQELSINTEEAMETQEHELVVESQADVEHEEEVVQSEAEIEPQEVEVQSEDQNDGLEEVHPAHKNKPTTNVPPLRPLNIAPKPEQVPIAVKSVSGQPLILVPGGSGSQAIKLVNPQGQEINLANYSLSRPITIKSAGKTITANAVTQTQPKPIFMKKIISTNSGQKAVTKPLSFAKPNQQLVVVQKSGDQQVKLVQAAPANNITAAPVTKTITLQQAQEMGLLGNAKIVQGGVQHGGTKRTVLINKSQQKTIKLIPQSSATQIATGGTKTISLAQFKSPTKILPAATTTNITGGKVPQRLIFKSASGSQVLPAGQLIQVGGSQGIANGQIHQINVPGKGMQYIKFVTSTSGESSNSTVTVVNTVKATSTSTVQTAVMSDMKPIITATKLVTKPATSTKPTQVMLVPAGYLPANIQQIQKVAIPAVKQSAQQQKQALATVPRTVQIITSSPETTSPSSTATTTVPANDSSANANGIRPRKPCNCTKSQCLKLYCDCFANGEFCYLCNCMNCFNNLENEETRNLAIKACLERNSNAFRPKIGKAKDTTGDVLRKHTKGCNCKRSGCLKNYCECYEAKIACSNNCKCVGCRNIEDSFERKSLDMNSSTQRITDEQLAQTVYRKILPHYKGLDFSRDLSLSGRKKSNSRKQPITYITDEVIEATCQCLLTISDDADSNMQDEEITKRQIIEEFGGCLNEIIHCSLNRNAS